MTDRAHPPTARPATAVRRTAVAVAAGLAVLASLLPGSAATTSPAHAAVGGQVVRTYGPDRYATSAAVSADTFAASAHVVIASGEAAADGLSAAALAGQLQAPVLLVPATGALPATVRAEMARLGATTGHVVGGPAAVGAGMEDQLRGAGLVLTRYSGTDRYDTSRAIAAALTTVGTDDGKATAFLASGEPGAWADALAASAPAFAAVMPLVLTDAASLPAATRAALTGHGVRRVIVVGARAQVGEAVVAQVRALGIEVLRLSGPTHADTAAALAGYLTSDSDFAFARTGAVVVPGSDFADALAAGPHAGTTRRPVLFVGAEVPAGTGAYLAARAGTLTTLRLVGGPRVVPDGVVAALKAAVGWSPVRVDQPYAIAAAATRPSMSSLNAGETDLGRVRVTVTVPWGVTAVNLRLLPAASVTTGPGGAPSFASRAALAGDAGASIEAVNGVGAAEAVRGSAGNVVEVLGVAPVGGRVVLDVDSAVLRDLVVLAWSDTAPGGGAGQLDLDPAGVPLDAFAVTAAIAYQPVTTVTVADAPRGRVSVLDRAAGTVAVDEGATVAGDYDAGSADRSFAMDGNDSYLLAGAPVPRADFLAALSRGDVLDPGAYASDPAQVSVFDLAVDGPLPPVVTTQVLNSEVTLVLDPSAPTTVARYDGFVIERAQVTGGTAGPYATLASAGLATDEDFADATFRYTDTVPPGVYRYRVAGVVDADAGAAAVPPNVTVTPDTTAPRSIYASLITDVSPTARAGAGDVLRVILDEPVAVSPGAVIRVKDGLANGPTTAETFDLTHGLDAALSTNTAPVRIGDSVYAPGRILTVAITGAPVLVSASVPAGNGFLDNNADFYWMSVSGIRDPAGYALSLATSPDRLFSPDTAAPSLEPTIPTVGNAGTDRLTLRFNKAVRFADNALVRGQFAYKGVVPTAVTRRPPPFTDDKFLDLVFPDGVVLDSDDTGTLTYTASASAPERLTALNGKTVATVTFPNVQVAPGP